MRPHRSPFLASLVLALAIVGQWALFTHHYQHDLLGEDAQCQICLHAQAGTDYLHSSIVQVSLAMPQAEATPPRHSSRRRSSSWVSEPAHLLRASAESTCETPRPVPGPDGGCSVAYSTEEKTMRTTFRYAVAVALAFATPLATAASQSQVAALKEEIEQDRQSYEARLAALEARLKEVEKTAATAQVAASTPPPAPAAANAFNPGIGVVLDARCRDFQRGTDGGIAGFTTGEEAGRGLEGLSLGESEVNFAANVDDTLDPWHQPGTAPSGRTLDPA